MKIDPKKIKSWTHENGFWVCRHKNGFIGFGKTKKEAYINANKAKIEDFIGEFK